MDFAMISLTVLVVRKLQTKPLIKTRLTFIFAVGGLSGVIGFVKIGIVCGTPNGYGHDNEQLLRLCTDL
ncbi:hypothetical protein VSDG_08436 [Cytospora chrysosperma]|uniref:Uncharacterized protein n=1 Tax=Cytospora chrysosperma TaxID=252740 RepID=A0A423VHR3_CYTCH|nr:hypothetical protein VSDG_08436 [Valsa sordida]